MIYCYISEDFKLYGIHTEEQHKKISDANTRILHNTTYINSDINKLIVMLEFCGEFTDTTNEKEHFDMYYMRKFNKSKLHKYINKFKNYLNILNVLKDNIIFLKN